MNTIILDQVVYEKQRKAQLQHMKIQLGIRYILARLKMMFVPKERIVYVERPAILPKEKLPGQMDVPNISYNGLFWLWYFSSEEIRAISEGRALPIKPKVWYIVRVFPQVEDARPDFTPALNMMDAVEARARILANSRYPAIADIVECSEDGHRVVMHRH